MRSCITFSSRAASIPAFAGEGPSRIEEDKELLSGKKGWGGSSLHMAAATGRADVVQQLLLAGVSPLAWSPGSSQ